MTRSTTNKCPLRWFRMGNNVALLVTMLVFSLPFFAVWAKVEITNRRARQERRDRLMARGVLSEAEWFDAWCRPAGYSREAALAVAGIFATGLGCDLTNLRPADRFDDEFKFPGTDFLGLDEDHELEQIDSELADLLGPEAVEHFHELQTLGDVIVLYDSVLALRTTSSAVAG
jgi:hypothetical protein